MDMREAAETLGDEAGREYGESMLEKGTASDSGGDWIYERATDAGEAKAEDLELRGLEAARFIREYRDAFITAYREAVSA